MENTEVERKAFETIKLYFELQDTYFFQSLRRMKHMTLYLCRKSDASSTTIKIGYLFGN